MASVVAVREVTQVLADTGYFSEAAVAAVESDGGPMAYVAVEKTGHHRTVEPVFGIIKSAMGFRHFLLRGKRKVALEWSLITLAYNFRRLARLLSGAPTRPAGNWVLQAA